MGCSATTTNECTACFNYGTSLIVPRALQTNDVPPHCKNISPLLISGCKVYANNLTMDIQNATSDTCLLCTTNFLYWDDSIKLP